MNLENKTDFKRVNELLRITNHLEVEEEKYDQLKEVQLCVCRKRRRKVKKVWI